MTENSILVCFGDSLTFGYGALQGESYPDYLRSKLKLRVLNKGVNGDTTKSALKRFEKDVLDNNPDIVILELGANDLIQGLDPVETRKNLNYMVDELLKRDIMVYVVKFYKNQLIFSVLKRDSKEQFDEMFKELKSKEKVEYIDDIWSGVWGKHMYDAIHPNAKGYKIMGEIYFDKLKPVMKENNLIIGE